MVRRSYDADDANDAAAAGHDSGCNGTNLGVDYGGMAMLRDAILSHADHGHDDSGPIAAM